MIDSMIDSKSDSKIYSKKLAANFKELAHIDMNDKVQLLGLQQRDGDVLFDFFNRRIMYSSSKFEDINNLDVTDAIKTVLSNYILHCPDTMTESSNRLVSFREFNGAGPLFSHFAANTSKIIETTYSGHLGKLTLLCKKLGGTLIQTAGYDLSFRFRALHRVPVIFHFNDAEDALPATAVFLFHENADTWLDLQSLTLISTYLTGCRFLRFST
ncbi:MAG: DUF3786 domain-containing protein [Desulfobacula sp.]|nr:DUF3786 domain-containing protein [Desulfobacula sp.]